MPKINLRNVITDSPHFVVFDIEASGPEDGDPPGLYLNVSVDSDAVESFETAVEEIKNLRDVVVQQCNRAITLIEGG